MGASNFGDVLGPVFPMAAVAALLHYFGIDGALDFANFKLQAELFRRGAVVIFTTACADAIGVLAIIFAGVAAVGFLLSFSVTAMISILAGSLPIKSSLLTMASKRSSCERRACNTCQTTL